MPDVKTLVNELWAHRADQFMVQDLSEKLVTMGLVGDKTEVRDLEYYLPQLCHMVIHGEGQTLERFVFAVSQANMHIALMLSFYLRAAMEDFQPELGGEKANPASNPTLFYRCARLLQNVERAVVYGTPESGGTDRSQEALAQLRRERADEILSANKSDILPAVGESSASVRNGYLLFKRNVRKSTVHTKSWKERFFRIEQQVLFCMRDEASPQPLRAFSLIGCTILELPGVAAGGKYDYSFEIVNATRTMRYSLRAHDDKSYKHWVTALLAERGVFNLLEPVNAATSSAMHVPSGPDSIDSLYELMTAAQRKRAHFFRQQVAFTDRLTAMADALRPVDKEHRKFFLQRDLKELGSALAPFVYVPMCSSLDTFSYVLRPLPAECHAFTTKARVPALMLFEVEEHPRGADVKGFMERELVQYPDSQLAAAVLALTVGGEGTEASNQGEAAESLGGENTISSRNNPSAQEPQTVGTSRISDAIALSAAAAATASGVAGSSASTSASTRLTDDDNDKANADATGAARITYKSDTIPELYASKLARLRGQSPFSAVPQWSVRGLIAKSNDDVRQEVFVIQLIDYYKRVFADAKLPLWLHTYTILSTSKSTGLIQLIPNAYSLDSIKKRADYPGSLRLYYEQLYGAPDPARGNAEPPELEAALRAFVQSMAAYSVVCYLLQIKDRHNGNIMIDTAGHMVHIDFGFVFGLAPGKAFSMELRVPWKLNKEMVAVMGGLNSPHYLEYQDLCVRALAAARKESEGAVALMEILTHKSNFPAFRYNPNAIADFKRRLLPRVEDKDLDKAVKGLLRTSYDNKGSDFYDQFQLATNGIAV